MTIFFYGPNSFALRQELGRMVDAYLKKTGSDMGLERIDAAASTPTELMAALQASPFLATSRLVIVQGAAASKTIGEKLSGMLGKVPSSTVAVFVEREVDKRTAAFKALKGADKVVEFAPLARPKMIAWVREEAKRHGGTMDVAAASELVELAGEDQWRMSEEVQKLVNFAPEITRETVRELVVPSVERSVFELVEAMAAGRAAVALGAYHGLLQQKQSEIYMLTMIQWQLRNLLFAKTAPQGMSSGELASAASMSPYVAGKMMSARGGVSEDVLVTAFKAAADCEFDIKTGRIKGAAAVEQLIYRVASSVKA